MDQDYLVLRFSVLHSQSINEEGYKVWIIIQNNIGLAKIVDSFCTCIAGHNGKCCHALGALTFITDQHVNKKTCTDVPCQWVKAKKGCSPKKIKELSFKTIDMGKKGGHDIESKRGIF